MHSKIIAWASASLDIIGDKIFPGGAPTYGGAVLNIFANKYHLNMLQIINMSSSDIPVFPDYVFRNALIVETPETVKLVIESDPQAERIIQTKKPLAKINTPFIIDTGHFNSHYHLLLNNLLIFKSGYDFSLTFFSKLKTLPPSKIFFDLFGRDDGKLSPEEEKILETILEELSNHHRLYFKLSEPEYHAAKFILKEWPNINLLITKGRDGAEYVGTDEHITVKGIDADVVSTLGAGDVFLYAFTALYTQGVQISDCMKQANSIAALSTEYFTAKGFYDAYINA